MSTAPKPKPVLPPPIMTLTKIGFDLDGTLDRPEIAALARLLYAAGVEIHIITVGALDGDGPEATEVMHARKVERLAFLSIPYQHLHVVTGANFDEAGEEKAAIVNYYELPIVIDDSGSFVKALVADTSAMVLHLKPGGNENEDA